MTANYVSDPARFVQKRFIPEQRRQEQRQLRHVRKLGRARQPLQKIAEALNSAGIRWWLSYGGLLGLVRDGKFLEWDNDFDLVVESSADHDNVLAAFTGSGGELITQISYKGQPTNENYWFEDVYFDIYYGFERKGGLIIYGRRFGCALEIIQDRQPIVDRSFDGLHLRVPADAERHLAHLYGATWRVPNPNWVWYVNEPIVEVRGPLPNLWYCYFRREILKR